MTPKERICAIRLLERFYEHAEYLEKIGVDIDFNGKDDNHVSDS